MVDSSVMDQLIVSFPNLSRKNFKVTSPRDLSYNCIAWAAEENDRWWWPDDSSYWPDNAPRENTLNAFIIAYQTLGYEICDNDKLELGFIKVAIYLNDDGSPSHAARQLENGAWASKLGPQWDVEHTLDGLIGPCYGRVGQVLKRETK